MMSNLAGAAVALVILIDLATGQGPPALNGYLAAMQPRGEIRPVPIQPIGYMPRGEYDEQAKEALEYKEAQGGYAREDFAKEGYIKEQEKEHESIKSTPAPGVLSSFSDTMSNAWKSMTALGRQTRSVIGDEFTTSAAASAIKGKSTDDYEWRQYNNQGYIFFKVPRNLVCSN